jgi:hypothetical protein
MHQVIEYLSLIELGVDAIRSIGVLEQDSERHHFMDE